MYLREDEMWQGENHGGPPAEAGDGGHAAGIRPGQCVERPADGNVPLQRERHDSQHARVRGTKYDIFYILSLLL